MGAIVSREAFPESDATAEVRVQTFLDGVETRRQHSNRAGWAALVVGALIASVAYLTSIGIVGPEARAAAASAGTLVVGYIVRQR